MSGPSTLEIVEAASTSPQVAASLRQAQTHATGIKEASGFALKAAERLNQEFPERNFQ